MKEAAAELAKQLFDGLRAGVEAITPGLQRFGAEVGAEVVRLGEKGAMEGASLLFTGQAFVPYGPGSYSVDGEHGQQRENGQEQAQEHEDEMGRER